MTWQAQTAPGAYPAKPGEADALLRTLPRDEADALRFLYAALPLGDVISCKPELLLTLARHALRVRALARWGAKIPEDIFRSFVLVPRVNNEPLEDHRTLFFEALWPRVRGLSMREAALEANYWCLEKATYQPTDSRTASPLTVARRAYGRCGEESTLLVCALRAVGIPARQCYVPRWAHCDDNHAWVEAWVEGDWHCMGACEPEPALDVGWFTAAATRTMLVRTVGFGWESGAETLPRQRANYSVINRTSAYAATRMLTVLVTQGGAPCPGIWVRFELANMGELYPIHTGVTDEAGRCRMATGLGALHLHAHNGERFATRVVDLREEDTVTLAFDGADACGPAHSRFDLAPPAEAAVPQPRVEASARAKHAARVEEANAARAAYMRSCPPPQGNGAEVDAFFADPRFAPEEKQLVWDTLTEKDRADVTAEALTDALAAALPYRGKLEESLWRTAILAPRVALEPLLPVRRALQRFMAAQGFEAVDGQAVWAFLRGMISAVDEGEGERFAFCDPRGILRDSISDRQSLDILFVQACRAVGIAARLNPVTGVKEAYAPERAAFEPAAREDAIPPGRLTLVTDCARPLQYGVQYTIARLEGGVFHTLRLEETALDQRLSLTVPSGRYRVLTCARQIDGTMLVEAVTGDVAEGAETVLGISLRREDLYPRLSHVRLDREQTAPVFRQVGTGHAAVLFAAPGEEPTEHLLSELFTLRKRVQSLGVKLVIVCPEAAMAHGSVTKLKKAIPACAVIACGPGAEAGDFRSAMGIGDRRLPLAVAVGQGYEGLFAFANYNVGTGEALLDILACDARR